MAARHPVDQVRTVVRVLAGTGLSGMRFGRLLSRGSPPLVDVTVARQPRSGGSPPVCANVLFTIFQVPSIFASDR